MNPQVHWRRTSGSCYQGLPEGKILKTYMTVGKLRLRDYRRLFPSHARPARALAMQ